MFSGIVEDTAKVVRIEHDQDNVHLTLSCSFVEELSIDQSVAHNGVCLTVVSLQDGTYTVTAMRETLECTNIGLLSVGDEVNVERSMLMNGRLDGHIVQGHVDTTAKCIDVIDENGSWRYFFEYPLGKENITVPKGSISVNGVSLTVVDSKEGMFSVSIIPYTYEHTNFHTIEKGTVVNLEFDIIGKYLCKLMNIA
jgi:riboflavin synthase